MLTSRKLLALKVMATLFTMDLFRPGYFAKYFNRDLTLRLFFWFRVVPVSPIYGSPFPPLYNKKRLLRHLSHNSEICSQNCEI